MPPNEIMEEDMKKMPDKKKKYNMIETVVKE
jgi:hypothetical protein